MTVPLHIQQLCDEFGIRIVGRHRYPEIGETRAVETMARICRRHGEAHLRLVLSTLAETSNNKVLLDEVGLWMCSDMILACARIVEDRAGDWLRTWDQMPVGELQYVCQDLRGVVPQRFALGGMVYERIFRIFGKNADQIDLFDDRRVP